MEQIYVQTEDLSVGYHGKVLLSDIALKVKKGEILVLIGPNGAGKSTIIKNIIREMNPIGGNNAILCLSASRRLYCLHYYILC